MLDDTKFNIKDVPKKKDFAPFRRWAKSAFLPKSRQCRHHLILHWLDGNHCDDITFAVLTDDELFARFAEWAKSEEARKVYHEHGKRYRTRPEHKIALVLIAISILWCSICIWQVIAAIR